MRWAVSIAIRLANCRLHNHYLQPLLTITTLSRQTARQLPVWSDIWSGQLWSQPAAYQIIWLYLVPDIVSPGQIIIWCQNNTTCGTFWAVWFLKRVLGLPLVPSACFGHLMEPDGGPNASDRTLIQHFFGGQASLSYINVLNSF